MKIVYKQSRKIIYQIIKNEINLINRKNIVFSYFELYY